METKELKKWTEQEFCRKCGKPITADKGYVMVEDIFPPRVEFKLCHSCFREMWEKE